MKNLFPEREVKPMDWKTKIKITKEAGNKLKVFKEVSECGTMTTLKFSGLTTSPIWNELLEIAQKYKQYEAIEEARNRKKADEFTFLGMLSHIDEPL